MTSNLWLAMPTNLPIRVVPKQDPPLQTLAWMIAPLLVGAFAISVAYSSTLPYDASADPNLLVSLAAAQPIL